MKTQKASRKFCKDCGIEKKNILMAYDNTCIDCHEKWFAQKVDRDRGVIIAANCL